MYGTAQLQGNVCTRPHIWLAAALLQRFCTCTDASCAYSWRVLHASKLRTAVFQTRSNITLELNCTTFYFDTINGGIYFLYCLAMYFGSYDTAHFFMHRLFPLVLHICKQGVRYNRKKHCKQWAAENLLSILHLIPALVNIGRAHTSQTFKCCIKKRNGSATKWTNV